MQIEQLADLNEEENRRIKSMFAAARGYRMFRGLQPKGGTVNRAGNRLFKPMDGSSSASVSPSTVTPSRPSAGRRGRGGVPY